MARMVKRSLIAAVILLSLAFTVQVTAATGLPNRQFWLSCLYSHSAFDDPLVFPGQPGASHLHDFFGNQTTNANSTYDTLIGQGTSCKLHDDTAGYWFPALIGPDGIAVPPQNINAYYWGTPVTQAFPPGFNEIARPGSSGPHGYYTCLKSDLVSDVLPDCGTVKVRAVVEFPDCWDGATNILVYSDQNACPSDHPDHLPRLILHITWLTTDASSMYLSSDPAAGFSHGESLHADFWNAWDQTTLETLVQRCYVDRGTPCKNLSG